MSKTKFITALALAAALLFSACNKTETGNTDVNVEVQDYTYDETTNTYTVYTAAGLLAWNEAAQIDTTLNCTLAADIDMTDIEWTPVGNDTIRYDGTFEGGDHTITGLTVKQDTTDYVGLIGYLDTLGKVQNLTLDNVSITGYARVGGVVGRNDGGTITDCAVSGNVTGSNDNVGGVVGENYGTVTACYHASGSVSGSGNYIGGVVGYNWYGNVIACYHASGSVSGFSSFGGVVGYNRYSTVTACYYSYDDGENCYDNNGEETTWLNAYSVMNDAISNWDSTFEWQYKIAEGNTLPTLTKK